MVGALTNLWRKRLCDRLSQLAFPGAFVCLFSGLLAGAALADTGSEEFIDERVSQLLLVLEQIESGSGDFSSFEDGVARMVDFPRISRFVLGRYGRGLDRDVYGRYADVYKTYVQGFYRNSLLEYAGAQVKVIGSIDLKRGDSVVKSQIAGGKADNLLKVDWRVRKQKDGRFRVLDLAVKIEGNQLWLAQEQRAQFMAVLDRSNGNVETLIAQLQKQVTAQ